MYVRAEARVSAESKESRRRQTGRKGMVGDMNIIEYILDWKENMFMTNSQHSVGIKQAHRLMEQDSGSLGGSLHIYSQVSLL